MRTLMMVAVLAVFGMALVGCKAEGEVGDVQSPVVAPQ
jgi:hypothetical protein